MSVDWFGCAGVKLRQVESLAWVGKERGVKTVELLRANSTRGSDRGDQRACCGRSVRHPVRTVLKMLKFSVPPGIAPLVHPPWPVQVVFCEAIGVIGGVESNRQGQDRHGSACPLGSGTTL